VSHTLEETLINKDGFSLSQAGAEFGDKLERHWMSTKLSRVRARTARNEKERTVDSFLSVATAESMVANTSQKARSMAPFFLPLSCGLLYSMLAAFLQAFEFF